MNVVKALKDILAAAETLSPLAAGLGIGEHVLALVQAGTGIAQNIAHRIEEGSFVAQSEDRAVIEMLAKNLAAVNDDLNTKIVNS